MFLHLCCSLFVGCKKNVVLIAETKTNPEMKNLLSLLLLSVIVFSLYSCEKEEDDGSAALCNNGILDGRETEIDCGGACTACPAAATFECTLGNTDFVSTNARGYILGPSIRIAGVDFEGRPMNFMFLRPLGGDTTIPISGGGFSYKGEPYSKGSDDTGHVTITAHDTLRKIISGRFGFSGNRVASNSEAAVKDGTFTNVRYGE
jgi:hypothetical protein